MGYTKDVDWVESAAMDLILLSTMQQYIDMGALVRRIKRDYSGLVGRLGFTAYF